MAGHAPEEVEGRVYSAYCQFESASIDCKRPKFIHLIENHEIGGIASTLCRKGELFFISTNGEKE